MVPSCQRVDCVAPQIAALIAICLPPPPHVPSTPALGCHQRPPHRSSLRSKPSRKPKRRVTPSQPSSTPLSPPTSPLPLLPPSRPQPPVRPPLHPSLVANSPAASTCATEAIRPPNEAELSEVLRIGFMGLMDVRTEVGVLEEVLRNVWGRKDLAEVVRRVEELEGERLKEVSSRASVRPGRGLMRM